MGKLLDAALTYYGLGYIPIPVCDPEHKWVSSAHKDQCRAPGKGPIRRWKDLQDARPPLSSVGAWFEDADEHQPIALVMGRGTVAIDVDKQNGGLETIARLAATGKALPEGPRATTPRGGFHVICRVDPAKGIAVGSPINLYPGIDLRGAGSILVAPPWAGREWQRELTIPGLLPELPSWMVADAESRRPSSGAALSEDALADLMFTRVAKGERRDTLKRLVGHLRNVYYEDRARAMVIRWAAEMCDPSLDNEDPDVPELVKKWFGEKAFVNSAPVPEILTALFRAGWTQVTLATELGTAERSVRRWQNGEVALRSNQTRRKLERIWNALTGQTGHAGQSAPKPVEDDGTGHTGHPPTNNSTQVSVRVGAPPLNNPPGAESAEEGDAGSFF